MVGVARQAVADDLGIDLGAASLGVLVFLQHHHAGTLAHDEAVAILVVGARGPGRIVVEARRQGPAGGEARDGQAIDRRFRAAGHHHLRIAERDEPRGIADGMGAGGAGGHHRVVRALEAMLDGDVAAGQVDEAAGDEEGRDAARAALDQGGRGLVDAADAADA